MRTRLASMSGFGSMVWAFLSSAALGFVLGVWVFCCFGSVVGCLLLLWAVLGFVFVSSASVGLCGLQGHAEA